MIRSRAVLAVVTVLTGCAACGVARAADTVNGSISVERHATAARLVTVNGSIRLNEAVRVTGTVQAVNGSLTVANRADVAGRLANVNGAIRVAAAHVGGLIDTATGDIELGPNARVVVGPGSVVGGTLTFERDVKLYVSDRATIGRVAGATAVRFSGERPPQ
jgi:cytoskeletal protein CcmA (bactofilin family)